MSTEVEILISLLDNGLTNSEISKEMNLSRSSVVRLKSKYNLKSKFFDLKKEQKTCLQCGITMITLISESRKFCSKSCSATYHNFIRGDKRINYDDIIEKENKVYKVCENCENEYPIDRREMSRSRKFCSHKCQQKFQKNRKFSKIENNNLVDITTRTIKKFLIEKCGNKCMDCGWGETNQFSGRVPIELEHIDGNSENNKLDNLKLLCPNCHSLTSTYKALNKGNGRHQRMKRYNEGKSY